MVEGSAATTSEDFGPVDRIGDLIRRVANHEVAAYEELYRLLLPRACATARRILGGSQLVDDAVAEAAERVWRYAGTFRHGNGTAWYLTIVANAARSIARSHGRTDVISPEHASDEVDRQQRVIDHDGVHVSAEEAEYLERTVQAPWFKRLGRREQRIVVLRALGFRNAEIIEVLPEVTHNEIVRRAMKRARESFGQDYPEGL